MRRTPRLLLVTALAGATAAFVAAVALAVRDDPPPRAATPAAASPPGGTKVANVKLTGAALRGRKVFRQAGCGGCHTMAAAKSTGAAGPDLDVRQPTADRVARQVRRGGPGMPSFAKRLKDRQIRDVAAFVAKGTAATRQGPVVTPFIPDGTTLESCAAGGGDQQACLQMAFGNVAYADGAKRALEVFAEKMTSDPAVESGCHRIAHFIGAASLARLKGDAGTALAEGNAICWSGYYHGVLERAFAGVSNSRLAPVSRKLCEGDAVHTSTFIYYQCVHGLGHGLMIHTGYDLPLSLKTCDGLETSWDQSSCTGGVFMENISSSYGVKSRWLRSTDLLYPCNAVASRHKLYCYLMVTSRVLEANGFDWDAAAAECRRAEKGWIATCFQSFGRDASGNSRQDPVRINELCAKAGGQIAECLYGASRDVTSNDAGGKRAATVCDTAPEAVRGRCWDGIGTILGTLHESADDRQAACRELTTTYLGDCARGAGAPVVIPPESVRPNA